MNKALCESVQLSIAGQIEPFKDLTLIRGSAQSWGRAFGRIYIAAFLVNISLSNGLINLSALRYRGALSNIKDYNLDRGFARSSSLQKRSGGRIG